VSAGLRVAACLGIGIALWVLFGAVRGAQDWQVSGSGYVIAVVACGALMGLVASVKQPRHWAHAGLLVIPGLATLAAAGPDAHEDAAWWYLSILIALLGAAGAHWAALEVRRHVGPPVSRLVHRRSALAGGPPNR
jgi:hypothetical protein